MDKPSIVATMVVDGRGGVWRANTDGTWLVEISGNRWLKVQLGDVPDDVRATMPPPIKSNMIEVVESVQSDLKDVCKMMTFPITDSMPLKPIINRLLHNVAFILKILKGNSDG